MPAVTVSGTDMALIRALVEGAPTAMLVCSPQGRPLYANRHALDLLGYAHMQELAALSITQLIAPDDLDARPLDDRRIDDARKATNERPLLRSDGSHVWVATTTQRTPDGHLLFWLQDLSEQQRLERELRQSQKLESVGLLAAGLAHDLNNLLTVVTGHAELIELGFGGDTTRASAAQIGEAARRAATLTTKLLAFGRRQVLNPRPVDLNALVMRARPLLESLAGPRTELVLQLADDVHTVEVDPSHVEQALWNLVTNGCQALDGTGRLTIRTSNVVLDDHALASLGRPRPDGRFVALSVSDNGRGMSESTVHRVFDPFFTTKQAGSGLGLSVVHGVVTQCGGTVRVRSKPGQGSCFEMCFPRSEHAVAEQREPAATESWTATGTVLVVEDMEHVRLWLQQALSRRGFKVQTACDGEMALGVTASWDSPPSALVTDVNMPRMTGPELAVRLRQRWPTLPIVFMTGYAEEAALRALPAGSELLLKPFTAEQLLSALRHLDSTR